MVWDPEARPRRQRWPSHQTEDMGPMLAVPSSLEVVMRATGVPQYIIAGVMMECVPVILSGKQRR